MKKDRRKFEKTNKYVKETRQQGLYFTPLDLGSVKIVVDTHASFSNARRLKSQLGYGFLMVEHTGGANIVYYGSNKCKIVAR